MEIRGGPTAPLFCMPVCFGMLCVCPEKLGGDKRAEPPVGCGESGGEAEPVSYTHLITER